VVEDMIEGVLAANRLKGPAAERFRALLVSVLHEAVAHQKEPFQNLER
jgi:hypothetical protein